MSALTPFEGTPVSAVGMEVPNISGGLNEGLRIDPVEYHHGDEIVVVIRTIVNKVRFDPVVKGEPETGLRRVHVVGAETATIIDASLVADVLAAHEAKVEAAKDREKGVQRIPGARPDLDVHDDGLGDDDYDEDDDPPTLDDDAAPEPADDEEPT